MSDGKVKIFSRNQEDSTNKFPDIVERVPKCIRDKNDENITFIADGEVFFYTKFKLKKNFF